MLECWVDFGVSIMNTFCLMWCLNAISGLLPIFQWMISMERNPPPTRTLHTIERLQGWSMLGYYPLEHLYYLRAHNLIPTSIPALSAILGRSSKRISLNGNKLILWSSRFWLLYVVLQFAHLREDRKLLLTRQRNLRKGKGLSVEDKEDLRKRWDSLGNELVANAANLPLALHWFVLVVCITCILIVCQVSGEWYLRKWRTLISSVYFVFLTCFADLGHHFQPHQWDRYIQRRLESNGSSLCQSRCIPRSLEHYWYGRGNQVSVTESSLTDCSLAVTLTTRGLVELLVSYWSCLFCSVVTYRYE